MFTTYFINGTDHSSGALAVLANPYAAMPSLHAADALIVRQPHSAAAQAGECVEVLLLD